VERRTKRARVVGLLITLSLISVFTNSLIFAAEQKDQFSEFVKGVKEAIVLGGAQNNDHIEPVPVSERFGEHQVKLELPLKGIPKEPFYQLVLRYPVPGGLCLYSSETGIWAREYRGSGSCGFGIDTTESGALFSVDSCMVSINEKPRKLIYNLRIEGDTLTFSTAIPREAFEESGNSLVMLLSPNIESSSRYGRNRATSLPGGYIRKGTGENIEFEEELRKAILSFNHGVEDFFTPITASHRTEDGFLIELPLRGHPKKSLNVEWIFPLGKNNLALIIPGKDGKTGTYSGTGGWGFSEKGTSNGVVLDSCTITIGGKHQKVSHNLRFDDKLAVLSMNISKEAFDEDNNRLTFYFTSISDDTTEAPCPSCQGRRRGGTKDDPIGPYCSNDCVNYTISWTCSYMWYRCGSCPDLSSGADARVVLTGAGSADTWVGIDYTDPCYESGDCCAEDQWGSCTDYWHEQRAYYTYSYTFTSSGSYTITFYQCIDHDNCDYPSSCSGYIYPEDSYENDDGCSQYTYISPSTYESTQYHTICPHGDYDYFRFHAYCGRKYTFYTSYYDEHTDTYGYLGDDDCNIITSDDDGGDGLNFRIEWCCTETGYYKVWVRGYSSTYTRGRYYFKYFYETLPSCNQDAYESDDDCSSARAISPGSQDHTINMDGADVDWVTFTTTDYADFSVWTDGSSGDTRMWLYRGSCGSLTEVDYDDDGGTGLFSRIDATCVEPGTYYVKVDEYMENDPICSYTINLSDITYRTPETPTLSAPADGIRHTGNSVTFQWSSCLSDSCCKHLHTRNSRCNRRLTLYTMSNCLYKHSTR